MNGVFMLSSSEEQSPSQTTYLKQKAERRSPLQLCLKDGLLLSKNLFFLPYIMLPMQRAKRLPGADWSSPRIFLDYVIIGVLSVVQVPLMLAAGPAFFILPGWLFVIYAALGMGIIWGRWLGIRAVMRISRGV